MDYMGFVNATLGAAAAEEHRAKEIVDPFKRLPDAIVSLVLDKVSEAKYLCRCSLVSKRFSSLVYKSESVSFKIPVQIPLVQFDPTPRLAALPGKLVHAVTYPMGFLQTAAYDFVMRTSSPPYCAFDHFLVLDYLPKFLRKFTRLNSLVVEFDYSASGGGNNNDLNFTKQPALKWAFDSNSWCFILVMAPRSIDEEGKNIYAREADLHKVVFDIHFGIFVCTSIFEQLSCLLHDKQFQ